MKRTQVLRPHAPACPAPRPPAATAAATVEIRPARPDDAERVRDFLTRLSPDTRALRFFTGVGRPTPALVRALVTRDDRRDVLLAVRRTPHGDEVVGHAMSCHVVPPGGAGEGDGAARPVAEIGIVVADDWQGRGIGERLLRRLLLRAAARGATEAVMDVLAENHRLLRAIRRRWPDAIMRMSYGTVEVRTGLKARGTSFAE